MMSWLARQDGYDPNAFDVLGEQSTNVGWANRMGDILTARPQYDETVQYKTASPLVQITEGDIGRATEAAMAVSGGGMKVETPRGIRAFHSSPHDFDKFDLAKIGSGEGAQVYGHGLYFAESPAVSGQGGQYWQQFLNKFSGPEREVAERLKASNFDRKVATGDLGEEMAWLEYNAKHASSPEAAAKHTNMLEALRRLESGQPVGPRTYEVNINADPAHMLDWDKPLREQAPHVRDVLRAKNGPFLDQGNSGSNWGAPGSQYYKFRSSPGMRDPAQLSEQLSKEYGIPGIKYLDQGSRITSPVAERILDKAGSRAEALKVAEERLRTAGMGDLAYWDSMVKQFQPETSNFVIFDPNLIRIDKKYAVPGAIGAGGMGAFAAQDEYRQ